VRFDEDNLVSCARLVPVLGLAQQTRLPEIIAAKVSITAPRIRSDLELALGATSPLVVDLSQVDYFGSVFLAVLLRCWKMVMAKGGTMALSGVSARARELLAAAPGVELSDIPIVDTAILAVLGNDDYLLRLLAEKAGPAAVADYRGGKASAINFLKGQVMKTTRGKANPAIAEDLLRQLLG